MTIMISRRAAPAAMTSPQSSAPVKKANAPTTPAAMQPTTTIRVLNSPRNLPTRNCQRATGLDRMLTIVFLPSS